jgi:hypothetical protein
MSVHTKGINDRCPSESQQLTQDTCCRAPAKFGSCACQDKHKKAL